MHTHRRLWIPLLSVLAACAHRPQARRDPAAVEVIVEVAQATSRGERPLRPNAALRSGDRVVLRATVDRAAFLYVAWVNASGAVTPLSPAPRQERPQGPGVALRLPAVGGYALAPPGGVERLVLIAALRPLSALEPGLCLRYRLVCTTPGGLSAALSANDAPPPPPPPPDEDDITRRLPPWLDEQGRIHGVADGRGVALVEFPLLQTH